MRVDEIQILAADVLLPPPDLTVSQWADQNRRLSSESASEKGEWRTGRAPYQRAVMDAMGPASSYETGVMMWAAQSGKSSLLENFLGYIIELDPGPVLLVEPREVDAEAFSKDRLAPMLRDTPCLRGKVADARSRDSNNTILHKKSLGGSITLAAANSPAGLAMRSIRYCLLDEVDRYPVSAGSEEDPLAVGRPIESLIHRRVPCETLGDSAGGGHDKDIDVAVVFAGEGDLHSIGGETRIGLQTGADREAGRLAAGARDAPQVLRVNEDDVGLAEGGLLEEQALTGRGCRRERHEQTNSVGSDAHADTCLTAQEYPAIPVLFVTSVRLKRVRRAASGRSGRREMRHAARPC
jgi:hypothetical protein